MSTTEAPCRFLCPMSMEVMSRPMRHRHSKANFDRTSIMEGNVVCPITNKPLSPEDFVENISLEREIRKWRLQQISDRDPEDDMEDEISHSSGSLGDLSSSVREQLSKTRAKKILHMRNKVLQKREERMRQSL